MRSNGHRSVRSGTLAVIALSALTAAVLAPGCSFATNETAVQCSSEAECLAKGPDFAGTTCDPVSRTCLKVAQDQDLCSTNRECIDRAGGLGAICRKRDRKCVTLQTPECPTLFAKAGTLLDDNAVVIGAITPAGSVELGDVMEAAMAVAHDEITTQVRGLPAPDGSSNVRPFVILSCREFNAGGFEALTRGANHLAKNVGVPIVIGPIDPSDINFVMNEVFIPNRVLSIPPVAVSQSLTQLANPIAPTPIMWSATETDTGIASAAQELISKQLEAKLRAEGVVGPIRVALMQEDNFFGDGGANRTEAKLFFNGKNAGDNARDNNYLRVNIGNLIDFTGNPAPESKIAAAIAAVVDFKPHIVIHAYAPHAIAPTFFNLAFAWPPAVPHAYHIDVLTTFGSFAPLLDVLSLIPPLQSRVFAASTHVAAETKPRINQFVIKFKSKYEQFRNSATPDTNIVHAWYDSTYLAAYAIVANRTKPLNGENVATTITQFLPPGKLIRTGPEDLPKALGLLNSGEGIDLDGISGHMNLDPRTGYPSPEYDIQIDCPSKDPVSGRITKFKPAGFHTENGSGVGVIAGCGE